MSEITGYTEFCILQFAVLNFVFECVFLWMHIQLFVDHTGMFISDVNIYIGIF